MTFPWSCFFSSESAFCRFALFQKKTPKSALSLIPLLSPHQPNVVGAMEKVQKGRPGFKIHRMERERAREHARKHTEHALSYVMGTLVDLYSLIPQIFMAHLLRTRHCVRL